MERLLNNFLSKTGILFEGTNTRFHEYDRVTEQLFLRVGPLFTDKHGLAIENFLQQYNSRMLLGGLIRDRTY